MIRNKRTTFTSCIDTDSSLTNRNTVPRLAGPIPDDASSFPFLAETPESIRVRAGHLHVNPTRTPAR